MECVQCVDDYIVPHAAIKGQRSNSAWQDSDEHEAESCFLGALCVFCIFPRLVRHYAGCLGVTQPERILP
jgi:hypothetical protein